MTVVFGPEAEWALDSSTPASPTAVVPEEEGAALPPAPPPPRAAPPSAPPPQATPPPVRSAGEPTAEPRWASNGNPQGVSFWTLVAEDYAAHESDWRSPGFRALFVHRFGNLRMSVRNRYLRAPLSMLYRLGERRVRSMFGIELPYSTRVGRRVEIHHHSGIIVSGYVTIGDGCTLRQNVTIGIRRVGDFEAPVLGKNVDIGAGAVMLGQIHIGDGARIGANAVVLDDVPSGGTAVGVPARIVPPPPSRSPLAWQ